MGPYTLYMDYEWLNFNFLLLSCRPKITHTVTISQKNVTGTRGSFLRYQSKHTKENSLPFSPREYTTSKCHGQAFIGIDVKRRSHCDTPSVGEGQRGSHGRPPAVRSICVGDAVALGPSACGGDGSLTGASASMDQLRLRRTCAQKHARVHKHSITLKHA